MKHRIRKRTPTPQPQKSAPKLQPSALAKLGSILTPTTLSAPTESPKPQNQTSESEFKAAVTSIITSEALSKDQKAQKIAESVANYGPATSVGVDPKAEGAVAAFNLLEEYKSLDTQRFRETLGEEIIRACCGKVTTTTQSIDVEDMIKGPEWWRSIIEQAPRVFTALAVTAPLLIAAIPQVAFVVAIVVAPIVSTTLVAFKLAHKLFVSSN